jgi:hypothetical protein
MFYKELTHLPDPPENLVNKVLDNWLRDYWAFTKLSNYPNLILKFDYSLAKPWIKHISTYDKLDLETSEWMERNVCNSERSYSKWILRVYYRYSLQFDITKSYEIYEKHLDSKLKDPLEQNNYVLIYNLTKSVGDLVFYQEPNKPLIREDRPEFITRIAGTNQSPHKKMDFPNAFEVFRAKPQYKKWYIARTDVIHSVENSNHVPRIAFQLRLSEREAKKYFELN